MRSMGQLGALSAVGMVVLCALALGGDYQITYNVRVPEAGESARACACEYVFKRVCVCVRVCMCECVCERVCMCLHTYVCVRERTRAQNFF